MIPEPRELTEMQEHAQKNGALRLSEMLDEEYRQVHEGKYSPNEAAIGNGRTRDAAEPFELVDWEAMRIRLTRAMTEPVPEAPRSGAAELPGAVRATSGAAPKKPEVDPAADVRYAHLAAWLRDCKVSTPSGENVARLMADKLREDLPETDPWQSAQAAPRIDRGSRAGLRPARAEPEPLAQPPAHRGRVPRARSADR